MLFKRLLLISSAALGAIVFALLALGEFRTWQVQSSPQQKKYLLGGVPLLAPTGFYAGYVPGLSGSPWQGKLFDPTKSSGVNIFVDQGKASAKYPFRTSIATSSRDGKLKVFKIDYNNSANPWWIRLFLDELVVVKPGSFLGKLSLKIIPGRPYQITFFELHQDTTRFRKGID